MASEIKAETFRQKVGELMAASFLLGRDGPGNGRQEAVDAANAALDALMICEHQWVDPSNSVVECKDHRLCVKCGALKKCCPQCLRTQEEWKADETVMCANRFHANE